MKIVIDIPEEDYKFIKSLQSLIIGGRGTCKTIQKNVINAIRKGTPYGEWIKIDKDSIKNLEDHYFYLVADKRYCTPMKAKYHEDYPQFELLSQRRTDNQTSCVCLLDDDCTITHYMELSDMPSEYRCSECSLNGRYEAQTCVCFKKGGAEE